jgi:hypothetical protein
MIMMRTWRSALQDMSATEWRAPGKDSNLDVGLLDDLAE